MKKIYKSPFIKLIELDFTDTLLGASRDKTEVEKTTDDDPTDVVTPEIDPQNPYSPGENW